MNSIIVKARLRLKGIAEGGREGGIKSGYRPNHVFEYFPGKNLITWPGEVTFEDISILNPGEECEVKIEFLLCGDIEKYLKVGRKWWIHEGGRQLGEAEILKLL